MGNDILSMLRNSQIIISSARIMKVYPGRAEKTELDKLWEVGETRKLNRERSLCSSCSTLSNKLFLYPQKEFNHYLDANSYTTQIDSLPPQHRKFLSSPVNFDTLFAVKLVLPIPRPIFFFLKARLDLNWVQIPGSKPCQLLAELLDSGKSGLMHTSLHVGDVFYLARHHLVLSL